MPTNIFDSLNEERVYFGYRNTKDGKEIMDGLVTMAKNAGFCFNDSLELAQQIMDQVYTYDNVREQVQEDVRAAMEQVFSTLETLEPEARLDAMNQMLFGLNMVSDETLLEELDSGADPMVLFQESSGKYTVSAPNAEQNLREDILRKVSNLHLSPKALARMGKSIAASSDYVATSAALGRKGCALKCVVAMDLYLKNRNTMDVDEAVLLACETVELEAVSDAIRLGELSETGAEILTAAAFIVLIIIAALSPTLCKTLVNVLFVLTVACAIHIDGKNLFELLGEKVALAAGYVKSGVETFQTGLERICSCLEAERIPAADTEEPVPAFDVQNAEEYI